MRKCFSGYTLGLSAAKLSVKKFFFKKRKYLYFLQNIYYLQKKIFSCETKISCRKKNITQKNFFKKENLSIQKIYVLQIKIHIFLNYVITIQQNIFDHKKYITSYQTL